MKRKRHTFTKIAVRALLFVGVVNASMPFVLALLDKETVPELGMAWITEIVAVILGYMLKSYHETKQERKQNHADYVAGMYSEEQDGRDDLHDTEDCG